MDLKRKAKRFAKYLQFMVYATALTSCGKENEIEINESVEKENEFEAKGISVSTSATYNDGLIHIYDGIIKTKMTDELYEQINMVVEESPYHGLHINLKYTPIDFNNINISNINNLIIDCSNIDFNYEPFYNKSYEHLEITIGKKTNKEDVMDFLQSVNLENSHLSLNIKEEVSEVIINEYLEAVSKIEGLEWISINTYSNINELTFASIKCNYLEITNYLKTQELNYNIVLNDSIKKLSLSSQYGKDEEMSYLNSLKISSNNKGLEIVSSIYNGDKNFSVNVDDNSVIMLPNNSSFDVYGLNIDNVSDTWYIQLSNVNTAKIKLNSSSDYSFTYNSEEKTIDEAVEDMHFIEEGNEIDGILQEHGVSVRMYNETMYFSKYIFADDDAPKETIMEQRIYDFINVLIEKNSIKRIKVEDLEKQIDFSKINLTNIPSIDLSQVGYDFDYTAFINQNKMRSPIDILNITVSKDFNHDNKLNYLNSISLKDDAYVEISFREGVDADIATTYLNALDYDKISQLHIHYDKIKELDIPSLRVPTLVLFDSPSENIINYNIDLNDTVQNFTLYVGYDEDYQDIPLINNVNINSSNNSLTTYLMVSAGALDDTFNGKVDDNTIISVPDSSNLYIIGIEEESVTTEFLSQFGNLNHFIIKNSANTYQYSYTIEDSKKTWYYYGDEKEEAQEKGKELLKTQ